MEEKHKQEIENLQKQINDLRDKNNQSLKLTISDKQDLKIGIRKNGRKYSVRTNRMRFFYPNEWMSFYDKLKESQKFTFDCLINTGARINELQHVKAGDIDFDRCTLILRVTKVKAKKGEKNPKPRTFKISTQFARKLKKHVEEYGLKNEDYLEILSKPAIHLSLKKALVAAGIKDWWMFSTHNVRKTHGNWLKALGVESGEICARLGHDMNTFLKSYSSPDIFNYKDIQDMRIVLGDLYQR